MYPYDSRFIPPAPALTVSVGPVQGTDQMRQVMAQLDTGADISGVPLTLLDENLP